MQELELEEERTQNMLKIVKRAYIIVLLFWLCYPSIGFAKEPVVFFSDLTDGPILGWNGSSTKGAAVSIWGLGFGGQRNGGFVTIGGVNLTSDADYAEWGATNNPTTARELQRITFFLNASMNKGDTTIKVTTSEGTSGSIPFYTRVTGTIYFVSPTGDDNADGKTVLTPWLTAMKARGTVSAGDVVYFRGGVHTERDTTSVSPSNFCYIHFYNNNHAVGSLNNSITFAAYPAELVVFGDGTPTVPKFIRQVGYNPTTDHLDYWTFSKFKVQIYSAALSISTGSISTADYIRFIGFDATTTAANIGLGVCFWFTGNKSNADTKFYGNYVHHVGKPLNWKEEDGSGYRVGPIYFQGFGQHGTVDVGWNEFAWNNGQSQFYGHYHDDKITLLKYHDNYVHHTASAPAATSGSTAVFGGGDDNHPTKENYNYITECYVFNNIFYKNGGQIRFSDQTSYGSYGGSIYYWNNTNYGNTTTTSREFNIGNFGYLELKNNLIYTTQGSGGYFHEEITTWKSKTKGSNNLYYGLPNEIEPWEDPNTTIIGIDPQMVDPENGNFSLKSSSPCVDGGTAISFVPFDFNGVSKTKYDKYDIGAFELETKSTSGRPILNPPENLRIKTTLN